MGVTNLILWIHFQNLADPYGHPLFSLKTPGRELAIPKKERISC
jgi:hypothetical protein